MPWPLVWEFVVLTSGAIGLVYPSYALNQGYSVGRVWQRREKGFPAQAGFLATIWPLIHMIVRGQGWATLWIYPVALAASLAAAFLTITLLRHWVQVVALLGMTVGVLVMFLSDLGRH
jgi:Flp pilus assembly protein TadB